MIAQKDRLVNGYLRILTFRPRALLPAANLFCPDISIAHSGAAAQFAAIFNIMAANIETASAFFYNLNAQDIFLKNFARRISWKQ